MMLKEESLGTVLLEFLPELKAFLLLAELEGRCRLLHTSQCFLELGTKLFVFTF